MRSLRRAAATPNRRVALIVGLVAMLNGVAWGLLTPPFQVPDETAHFAYVQRLAESGIRPGDIGRPEFSSEQQRAMNALGTLGIIGRPLSKAPSDEVTSDAANQALRDSKRDARNDGGGPSTASSQPPLFYALSVVPYRVFGWASLTTRVYAIRLLAALIFAMGAACCCLFVLEALPGRTGAAFVGGLAVALSPYTAFIASGVNPDTLLLAVSSGVLLGILRAARRGLTTRRAAAIGLLVGAGLLTKLTFLGFVLPAFLAVSLLVWQERRRVPERWLGAAIWFIACLAALPALFLLWLAITGRDLRPPGTSTVVLEGPLRLANTREMVSYAWQLFLPRLPFMTDQFTPDALRAIWLDGYAGRYGWLDYSANTAVITAFSRVAYAALILCCLSLVLRYRSLRSRWVEIVVGVLFFVGLWALIAKAGYDYKRTTGFTFEQPRYLFPVAAFWALLIAGACAALGRRAFPYLGTGAVAFLCFHDISGIAFTVERYYG